MMQWSFIINGKDVPQISLLWQQPDYLISDVEIAKLFAFDAQIKISNGNSFTVPDKQHTPNPHYPWYEERRSMPIPESDATDEKGTPLSPTSIADTLIISKVASPHGDSDNLAKVIWRSPYVKEQGIVNYNEYPILNTCIYDVELQYGIFKPYAENVIAKHILSQVDSKGYHYQLLESISE